MDFETSYDDVLDVDALLGDIAVDFDDDSLTLPEDDMFEDDY